MISMEEKIAIVIPAYKCRFLRQTLDSIVVQTCRSFTVYIGDDASPQNLKEIVSDYADKMNIVYRRFDTNLGGVDLPGHWDRCIALAKEPVVWFFSDDDLMPQDGVERIIKALECYGTKHGISWCLDVIKGRPDCTAMRAGGAWRCNPRQREAGAKTGVGAPAVGRRESGSQNSA
jgi:glycosyltransferase involved in cell wall biosynthesis